MLTEQTIKKFHLVQTSGQLIILLVCGLLGLTRGGLFEQTQMFDVLLCLLLSLLEFSLLVPEKESPKRWQLFNHYFETVALCYTMPESLFFLTQTLNHYHLVNMTIWIILVTLYSFVMYIPMAKLALGRVRNNWGRILLFAGVVYNSLMWTPSMVVGSSHYAKILMQMNNSGLAGIPVLVIITLIIMPEWKVAKPHFTISRQASLWSSSLIILLLVAHLVYIILPTILGAYSLDAVLDYYLGLINLGVVFTALEAGIAEEWLMRLIVIALLAQVFQGNKYRVYLIVLTDGLIFGSWHLANVSHQTLASTLQQMVEVGGWALLIAAVYLYTHSLLLTMTYHGLYDFTLFMLQGGISVSGSPIKSVTQPTAYEWQVTLISVAICAIIALIIISGKHRRRVIEGNLATL